LYFVVVRIWLVNWLNYRWIWVGFLVAQLVEALRYNAESRGFDSPWFRWDILNITVLAMALDSYQTLMKMSNRHILWMVKRVGA
jgi:hypothetical protein